MYTRCPSCRSTFRVTATLLQMADGDVRCGSCGTVFNALQTLADTLPEAAAVAEPEPLPAADEAEVAAQSDDALEFDAPEADWQRFFIAGETPALRPLRPEPPLGAVFDTDASPAEDDAAAQDAKTPNPAAAAREATAPSLEEETADTDTWKAFLQADTQQDVEEAAADAEGDHAPLWVISDEADDQPGHVIPPRGEAGPDATAAATPDEPGDGGAEPPPPAPPTVASADEVGPAAMSPDSVAGTALPGSAPDTVLDWGPPPVFSSARPPVPTHTARWLAAALAAALVLAGQLVHHFRDRLAADPQYGALVRDAYNRLGQTLYPHWPLDAYEIRGVKAIAENSAPGALDIVAEIAVTGTHPVGAPMLRVVLRDRWGNPVASGVFDVSEYLVEAATPAQVYAPGALIPVGISLEDPGSSAQGYEVDVCLPDRQRGLQCKATRDPYRK